MSKIPEWFLPIVAGYNEKRFWRLKALCAKRRNPLVHAIYLTLFNRESRKFGAYVGYNAKFASPPTLPHGLFGIFITDHACIGKNCVIFHHVTIGSNSLEDSKGRGAPIIGDDCYLGAGAKIIGNVTVGDGVRIGANCVVTKDVPSNSTVVLPQPRIFEHAVRRNEFVRLQEMPKST